MSIISGLRICALALGLALWAGPASALSNSFNIPLRAVGVFGGASANTVIGLPNVGNPSFLFSFVLPVDYRTNERVNIVLYLSTSGAPCTMRLVPVGLSRMRAGLPIVNNASGLSAGNRSVDLPGGNATVVLKALRLRPGASPPGQVRGDAISIEMERDTDDVADTCGIASVLAIDIRYPSRSR